MAGRIHASRGHRLTQITWYRRSDTKGARKQSRVFPAGTMVTIGRGPDQAIILDDDGVSRNHARVEINHGKVLFEDLGSTNGSLLNGTQRIKRMDWRPGQRIRVGNYMLEVAFGVDEASDATIIGPVRRPLGHLAGMPPARPKQQRVLPRVVPAAQARLDPPPADPGQPLNRTVVDEGQDAARPIDAGVAPGEVAIPQNASQHPFEIAAGVGEMASSSKPSAEEAEATSTGISAIQADIRPPLEMTGNASSIIEDAKGVGSPPIHDTEATPARVSTPQAQDTPWPAIAGSADQSVDETQNGTHSVQESALLGATSAQAIVHPLPEMAHSVGPIIDTTGQGPPLRADAVSMPPGASVPQLHGTLVEHQAQTNNQFAYDAFISYRHVERDRKWAEWLIDALERYRLPKSLQEKGYPPRLGKIFHDADEAPAASDLNEQIKGALRASRFLIVVCSASTLRSKWVQREIEYFNELGRGNQVLALLTEGESEDSFPSLMLVRQRQVVEPDGTAKIVKEVKQPLAADVRPTRHQSMQMVKHLALLRLVASMLGVKFDDLRQCERERRRRTLAALTAALFLVIAGSGVTYWEMMHPKIAYYRQLVWRWGVPEGLGLIDNEIRGRRFLTYKVTTQRPGITQSPRVVEVRLENSAGQLSGDGPIRMEDGTHARWVVRYREDGTLDKIEIYDRTGHLMREEVFRKDPSKDTIIVDFERRSLPLTQTATQTLMFDPLDTRQQGFDTKSEISRHELSFDKNGFVVERHYLTHWGERQSDAQGSFGQRFTYTHEGLVLTRVEIGADNKQITLRDGQSAAVFTYDGNLNPFRCKLTGADGQPINGPNGFAYYSREFDRWGNDTVIAYYGTDGKPVLHKDGYAKITKQYDDRGYLIEGAHFGLDGNPTSDKDGVAKGTIRYDDRGNVVEVAVFDVNDKPTPDKQGVTKYTIRYDPLGRIIETAAFDVDEKPVAFKAGYARITHSYDEKGRSLGSKYFDKDNHEVTFDVVVTKIVPGTTAERIGLAPQDRIVIYNDVKPTSVQQFVDLAISTSGATSRRLVIRRDQNILTFEVPAGRLGVYLDTAAQDSGSTRRE
jgi:MTH538 TIR-like domain (DUF1863)/FHA domain/PDZ domain